MKKSQSCPQHKKAEAQMDVLPSICSNNCSISSLELVIELEPTDQVSDILVKVFVVVDFGLPSPGVQIPDFALFLLSCMELERWWKIAICRTSQHLLEDPPVRNHQGKHESIEELCALHSYCSCSACLMSRRASVLLRRLDNAFSWLTVKQRGEARTNISKFSPTLSPLFRNASAVQYLLWGSHVVDVKWLQDCLGTNNPS